MMFLRNSSDGGKQESPSLLVIRTVAVTKNQEPTDLPPLNQVIDPDALDAIIASMGDGEVSFSYAGYKVSVSSSLGVSIEPKNE